LESTLRNNYRAKDGRGGEILVGWGIGATTRISKRNNPDEQDEGKPLPGPRERRMPIDRGRIL